MRIPRIYTAQTLLAHQEIELETEASHHLAKVLRMTEGRALILFNGSGKEYQSKIVRIGKHRLTVAIGEQSERANQSPLHSELAIGLSKGDRFELVLQKATELGVTRIVPLTSERCEVKLSGERLEKKHAAWEKILIAACEQCQRNVLPVLQPLQTLANYVAVCDAQYKFVLHHRSDQRLWAEQQAHSVSLVVGPEGGLSEAEITLCEQAGFAPLRLGNRVLRTETAPITALSIMQYLWGDLH